MCATRPGLRALCIVTPLLVCSNLRAEDGYDLWLRYKPVETQWLNEYRQSTVEIVAGTPSVTLDIAKSELIRGLRGLLDTVPVVASALTKDGSVIIGTPKSLPLIGQLHLDLKPLRA